jgi:hypothetical protein
MENNEEAVEEQVVDISFLPYNDKICNHVGKNGRCKNVCKLNGFCGRHYKSYDVHKLKREGKKPCANRDRGCENFLAQELIQKSCDDCLIEKRAQNNKAPKLGDHANWILHKDGKCNYNHINGEHKGKRCPYVRQEHGFCDKHKDYYNSYKKISSDGGKMCTRISCKNVVPSNSQFTQCDKCRNECREYEQKQRDDGKANPINENGEHFCTVCTKYLDPQNFIGDKGQATVQCKECRNVGKNVARDEDKRREDAKIYDFKRRQVGGSKYIWNQNNRNKLVMYCMNATMKKINELGIEMYRKMKAIGAQKWRDDNPERMEKEYTRKSLNCDLRLNYYKHRAKNYDPELEFLEDEKYFKNFFKSQCHYCGLKYEGENKPLLGVDRKNSLIGYTVENCVACCEMCNFMKGNMDYNDFLEHCKLIAFVNGIVDLENVNKYATPYSKSASYGVCQSSASARKKGFSLTDEQHSSITCKPCYICNKHNDENHQNGIDRIDNSIGYHFDNCRSCCSSCNYIKRKYHIIDIFIKFVQIVNNFNENVLYVVDEDDCVAYNNKNCEYAETVLINNVPHLMNLTLPYKNHHIIAKNESIIEEIGSVETIIASLYKKYTETCESKRMVPRNLKSLNKITKNDKQKRDATKKITTGKIMVKKYNDEDYKHNHAKEIAEKYENKNKLKKVEKNNE